MRIFSFTFIIGLAIFSTTARADIYDRINSCQNFGGGTCVFDLLRELAGMGSSASALQVGSYRPTIGNCGSDNIRVIASSREQLTIIFSGDREQIFMYSHNMYRGDGYYFVTSGTNRLVMIRPPAADCVWEKID